MATHMIKEAVGLFDDRDDLDAAVSELESTKFPRQDISVLGDESEIEDAFGSKTPGIELLQSDPRTPRKPPVRPEEQTIGASALVGGIAYVTGTAAAIAVNPAPTLTLVAGIALGSIVGGIIGMAIVLGLASRIQEKTKAQIRRGGLLLWVRTPGPRREQLALHILKKYNARRAHIHTVT